MATAMDEQVEMHLPLHHVLRHCCSLGCSYQPGLAPENLTTLPHFSTSSANIVPKSAGVPLTRMPPRSRRRALILGSAIAALISRLSLAMMSGGVSLGAPMP